MFRSFRILAVCILCGASVSIAWAQSNWLEKGKSLLGTVTGSQAQKGTLSTAEIGAGLKEALRVGTETVVANLGRTDGFNADELIHIPLPDSLKTVQKTLKRVGMSSMLDDLELRLNRAAETATPKAKALFRQAIEEMTLDDVKGIYEGPEDATTRYFQARMSTPLADEMRPIVNQSLAEVGAIKAYEGVMGEYRKLPFVPDAKADLTQHVLDLGMKGIFHYVAEEEAAIRANPVKRTTALLQKVFGAQ